MSKSAGNFFTVEDVLNKGVSPIALRYLLLSTHYRTHANFTFEAIHGAKQATDRLNEIYGKLKEIAGLERKGESIAGIVERATSGFTNAMDDDLNISAALSVVFDFVRDVNKKLDVIGSDGVKAALFALSGFDNVLGCIETNEATLDQQIIDLIHKRDEARKLRDFIEADRIRDMLKLQGIILKDTPQGTRWQRI
jgi:cysteinyl-tRNA synthetase